MLSGRAKFWVRSAIWGVFALALLGCSEEKPGGAIQMRLINTKAAHCSYAIEDVTLATLDSVVDMAGKIGKVMLNSDQLDSDDNILKNAQGFSAVNMQLGRSGDTYFPLDYGS